MRHVLVPLLVILLALTVWSPAHAQTTPPTLQDAISAGEANVRFYGTGGSSGDSVMAEVSKGPKAASAPKPVTVPPGSQLESSDAGAQSMMVLEVAGRVTGPNTFAPSSNIVIPTSGTVTYLLKAFCAEFHKENPSDSTHFTLRAPNATLQCIARESLQAHASLQATQAAVWMYTDRLTFQEMNEKFDISAADWASARQIAGACNVSAR